MRSLHISLLSFVLAFGIQPQEPNMPQAWNANTVRWQKVDPDGTKWAVLQGRDDVPGKAFTYAAFIPAGYHDRHSHGSDARIAVVQGSLKVGFGDGEPGDLKSYPVGTFLFVPANVEHTMGADVDTIIIGTATGPWHTSRRQSHQHR
jgi:quercetin dioxygenase-like cupin family protein